MNAFIIAVVKKKEMNELDSESPMGTNRQAPISCHDVTVGHDKKW